MGILAALQHTGGVWFGWSGQTSDTPASQPELITRGKIRFATIDLKPDEFDGYYNGYCNGTLWPLFHYFPDRFTHEQNQYEAYQTVNEQFARQLLKILEPGDAVWVHDYQLISLGRYLRRAGFTGPLGFFLHIPFPHLQILRLLPHYAGLLSDMGEYDLVGFQTESDASSYLSCFDSPTTQRVGAYPIGIDVDSVVSEATMTHDQDAVQRMAVSLMGRKLIIGVDRLDYTKGLTERFHAYEQFLETFPDNQGQVTFLQIAPTSRSDVEAYGELRRVLEQCAGRINGRFAEADWTPIRYLNRGYTHATTMGFLRAAKVGLVTPVRDGMNLVAKEFVAAQDPEDPGVLILSPMAGAAEELHGALQVNPYDKCGMAEALQMALKMPLQDRKQRHEQMMSAVRKHDIHNWYGSFVHDLTGADLRRAAA